MSKPVLTCLMTLLAACGGIESQALNPTRPATPTTETPVPLPTTAPPEDPPPVAAPAWSVHCVSNFVDHSGTSYLFEVFPKGTQANIRLQRVSLPAGVDLDNTETPAPELLFEGTAPFDKDLFVWGFEIWSAELGDIAVGLNHGFDRGFGSGRMSRVAPSDESLVDPDETFLALFCFESDVELPASYDADAGRCFDSDGQPAMNDVPLPFVLATGLGQCARLEGRLNGEAFGYPIFRDLDLKGADLSQAELSFAHIHRAQLEGAQLGGIEFGYAYIDGSIDEHTQLPEVSCDGGVDGNAYRCLR